MNSRINSLLILACALIIISALCFPAKAQTIIIDSTFTEDGIIYLFSQNDTLYGLSISGSVTLNSDTSLVRVILADQNGNEWMVYEAYPMIVTDTSFDIVDECDETCFLDACYPGSIKILIVDAAFDIDSLNCSETGVGDMAALQYQAKRRYGKSTSDESIN